MNKYTNGADRQRRWRKERRKRSEKDKKKEEYDGDWGRTRKGVCKMEQKK